MGADVSASFEDLNVSIHGVQVFHIFQTGDAQRAVHRADVLDASAMRNANRIFNRDLHAFVLRIPRGDRYRIRARVDFNRNALEVGFLLLRRFHGVNLRLVTVPTLNFDGAIHVLQLKRAAGLQWVSVVEVLANGITGRRPKSSAEKNGETKNGRAEAVT